HNQEQQTYPHYTAPHFLLHLVSHKSLFKPKYSDDSFVFAIEPRSIQVRPRSDATLAQRGWRFERVSAFVACELKRKKPARQKEEDFHHNVYVGLLKDAITKHPSILRLNPKRDPLKPCVYVGMTGIPVDHRFENHKNGYISAWVVRK